MDKQAAKREAHSWVAGLIDMALCAGASFPDHTEADGERIEKAVAEIRDSHGRAAVSRPRRAPTR